MVKSNSMCMRLRSNCRRWRRQSTWDDERHSRFRSIIKSNILCTGFLTNYRAQEVAEEAVDVWHPRTLVVHYAHVACVHLQFQIEQRILIDKHVYGKRKGFLSNYQLQEVAIDAVDVWHQTTLVSPLCAH